ncbi:hypothetical protein [Embleya sp. NPDC005971]|uniref:hypothetical protein n=1 Tax=unclassified Embleya TaxID=2699296 RepID=UPI0033C0B23C
MAIATDLKKTLTDSTPLYAVAGAGDLMVEKLRELPDRFRAEVTTDPKVLRERLQTLPDRTQTFAKSQVDRAKELYGDLAARGEKLVKRVDRQESTKQAKAAVRTTESKAKGTTTAAKRGVANARTQAKSAATAAGKAAGAAADAVEQAARKVGDSAGKPAAGANA